MANAKTSITNEQIVAVIHDKEKSRKDREREAVDMVRQQMAEAKSLARERAIEDRIRRRMRD